MANYRVLDIVIVDDSTINDEHTVDGTITAILEDRGLDGNSRYMFESEDDGESYFITDDSIVDLLSGPTLDIEEAAFREAQNRTNIPEEPNRTVEEIRIMEEAARNFLEQNPIGEPTIIRTVPEPGMNMEFLGVELEALRARMNRELDNELMWGNRGTFPTTNPFDNITIQRFRNFAQVETENENIEVAPAPQLIPEPLDDHEGRQIIMAGPGLGVQSTDYNPIPGATRRLMSFRVSGLGVITPHLVAGNYVFMTEDGREWINQHQDARVRRSNTSLADSMSQSWDTPDRLVNIPMPELLNGFTSKKPLPKRKKLYRKHPIPDIKDEKYYAGKEFIA